MASDSARIIRVALAVTAVPLAIGGGALIGASLAGTENAPVVQPTSASRTIGSPTTTSSTTTEAAPASTERAPINTVARTNTTTTAAPSPIKAQNRYGYTLPGGATSIAVHTNGFVAVGTRAGDVVIGERNGERQRLRASAHAVRDVTFSPQGDLAAVGQDGVLRVWRFDESQGLYVARAPSSQTAHEAPIRAVVWSSDGSTIATGSDDGTVGLWSARDLRGQPGSRRPTLSGAVLSIALAPDWSSTEAARQRVAASTDAGAFYVFNPVLDTEPQPIDAAEQAANAIRYATEQGHLIGVAPGLLRIWQPSLVAPERLDAPAEYDVHLIDTAFAAQRLLVAAAVDEGKTRKLSIWSPNSGRPPFEIAGFLQDIVDVAFSSQGEFCAAIDISGALRVVELQE